MSDYDTLITQLDTSYNDPTNVLDIQLNAFAKAYNNEIQFVDGTSPLMTQLQLSAIMASDLSRRLIPTYRKRYPTLAITRSQLYDHMASTQYIGIFSAPAITTFNMFLRRDEILQKAVAVPGTTIRKLVLPRYMSGLINDTRYVTAYPIEIRIMNHGGISVVYDTSESSPLQSLETNVIDWRQVMREGELYIEFQFSMLQLIRTQYNYITNADTGFREFLNIKDRYHHCRVFSVSASNVRTEIKTTHSEEIYDENELTALIQVFDSRISVTIPVIYFSKGLVPANIEIETFTTKGVIDEDYRQYNMSAFRLNLGNSYVNPADSIYSAPFDTWNSWGFYSSSVANGGANGLTFEQLRHQVIQGQTVPNIPISDAQLEAALTVNGYDVVLSVDTLAKRIFLATRNMPTDTASGFSRGVACAIDTFISSVADLAVVSTIINNGARVTITPETVFQYVGGEVQIPIQANLPNPNTMTIDEYTDAVNSGNYIYTPFYYVVDTTDNKTDLRAYHFDTPEIGGRLFVGENDTTSVTISVRDYTITKSGSNWHIRVRTVSDDGYKAIPNTDKYAQLSYQPRDEVNPAYINGTLVGTNPDGEFVWDFVINSTLDVDSEDHLYLNGFTIVSGQTEPLPAKLTETFNIVFIAANYTYPGLSPSAIDSRLGRHLLPLDVVGLTQESFDLTFGTALTRLWRASRPVASSIRNLTYEYDIPKTWPTDVWETDPVSGEPKLTLNPDGTVTGTLLHAAGSPVIINGEPVLEFKAGDPVLDENKLPIQVIDRETLRSLDIMFVDGIYRFTTYARDVAYRERIPLSIVNYIRNDLSSLNGRLIEQTELFFYPKRSLGSAEVIISNEIVSHINAQQSFGVKYYLTRTKYSDMELRNQLTLGTSNVINTRLTESTVGVVNTAAQLRTMGGEDIIEVELDQFGAGKDIAVFTALDAATRCSVKRILRAVPDGTFMAAEDIQIQWIRHTE